MTETQIRRHLVGGGTVVVPSSGTTGVRAVLYGPVDDGGWSAQDLQAFDHPVEQWTEFEQYNPVGSQPHLVDLAAAAAYCAGRSGVELR